MADDDDSNSVCICPIGCLISERSDSNEEVGLTRIKCSNAKCEHMPGIMHNDCFDRWEDSLINMIVKNCYRGKDWSKKEVEKALWTSDRSISCLRFVWRLCRCPCGGIIKKDIDFASCEAQTKLTHVAANKIGKSQKAKLPSVLLCNSPKKVVGWTNISALSCDIADRFGETKTSQSSVVKLPVGLHIDSPSPMTPIDTGGNAPKMKLASYNGWQLVGKDGRPKWTTSDEMITHDGSCTTASSASRKKRLSSIAEIQQGAMPSSHDESPSIPSLESSEPLDSCKIPPSDQRAPSSAPNSPASADADDGWQVVTTKRKSRLPAVEVSDRLHSNQMPPIKIKADELSFEFSSEFDRFLHDPSLWGNEEMMSPSFPVQSSRRNSADVVNSVVRSRRKSAPQDTWQQYAPPCNLSSPFQSSTSFDDININDLARDLENVDMPSSSSSDETDDNFNTSGDESSDASDHQNAASSNVALNETSPNYISCHLQSTESADIVQYRQSLIQLLDLMALYDPSYSL